MLIRRAACGFITGMETFDFKVVSRLLTIARTALRRTATNELHPTTEIRESWKTAG